MTNVFSAVVVEPDEPVVRTGVEQLWTDGDELDRVLAVEAATVKVADRPDVLPAAALSGRACVTGRTAVSQDRHGYPQIRSRTAERQLLDPTMCAMTDMSSDPTANGSSAVTGYPSPYTHVYRQQKEVS